MMMTMMLMMRKRFSSISIDTTYYNGGLGLLKYNESLEQDTKSEKVSFSGCR